MITSGRDVFIGGHLTEESKEEFRAAALRRGISMSALLSEIVELWLSVERDRLAQDPEQAKVEEALNREEDVPLPLEG